MSFLSHLGGPTGLRWFTDSDVNKVLGKREGKIIIIKKEKYLEEKRVGPAFSKERKM